MKRLIAWCPGLRQNSTIAAPEQQEEPDGPMVIYAGEDSDVEDAKDVFQVLLCEEDSSGEDVLPTQGQLMVDQNSRLLKIFQRTVSTAFERLLQQAMLYIPPTQSITSRARSLLPSREAVADTATFILANGAILTVRAITSGLEFSVKALSATVETSDAIGQALGIPNAHNGLGLPKAIVRCASDGAQQVAELSVEITHGFGREVLPVAIDVIKKAIAKRQR